MRRPKVTTKRSQKSSLAERPEITLEKEDKKSKHREKA
jgi:hypothetical protein